MRDDAVLRRALPLGRGLGRPITGAGGHYPPPCKGGGQGRLKYIVDILYACNKKYILHVYSIIMSL